MECIAEVAKSPESLLGAGPLSVVFAEVEAIAAVASAHSGELPLLPPLHISDEDGYLIVPDDIGMEIVDILRDADHALLRETLHDSLVALGTVERRGRGQLLLEVECGRSPEQLLADSRAYAKSVRIPGEVDPVLALNTLEDAQCTMLSALIDDEGLDTILRSREYIGVSWRVPEAAHDLQHLDPTHVWSRRIDQRSVGIEFALFQEYDELIALLRPAKLELSG